MDASSAQRRPPIFSICMFCVCFLIRRSPN
jgi:hypothetical protein